MPHPVMNSKKLCSRTKSTGHIIPFAAIAASVSVLLPLLFLPVSADSGIKGSLDTIRNMITDILKMGSNEEVARVLSSGVTGNLSGTWSMVQSAAGGQMKVIAQAVLSLYFVVGLIDMALKFDNLTTESFVRPFIGYVAATIFVDKTPQILGAVVGIGGSVAGLISNSAEIIDAASKASEITNSVRPNVTGFFSGFVVILQLLLPWFFSKIIGLVVRVIAYGVVIEFFVRAVFLPLTYGDLIIHGLHGQGFRYLKQFIAVSLQFGVMLMISFITGRICAGWANVSTLPELLTGIGKMLVAELACGFLMFRSGQICKEMMGA